MTWNSATQSEHEIAAAVVTWIRTARASGYGNRDWLPSDADIAKSALFERLRSGKEPLEFPPPVGFACPWYALVEDAGPHFVGRGGFAPHFHDEGDRFLAPGDVTIMQNRYRVVERTSDTDMIVRDAHHRPVTPYRFRLWFDPDWRPPSIAQHAELGGWFMQNVAFALSPRVDRPCPAVGGDNR